ADEDLHRRRIRHWQIHQRAHRRRARHRSFADHRDLQGIVNGPDMTASEILVPAQERANAAAMLQDYIAEMAQFASDVRAGQAYPYFDFYWSEPDSRWPFWLKLDDANAGFAFVRRDEAGMQMA